MCLQRPEPEPMKIIGKFPVGFSGLWIFSRWILGKPVRVKKYEDKGIRGQFSCVSARGKEKTLYHILFTEVDVCIVLALRNANHRLGFCCARSYRNRQQKDGLFPSSLSIQI